MSTWTAVLLTALLCFGLKAAGWLVPASVFAHPRVSRGAALLPVALLAGLVVVQTFSTGRELALDARAVGLAAAAVGLIVRAPLLVVVVVGAAAAAAVRAL